MKSFTLTLSNQAKLAGIHSIPPPSSSPLRFRPLIVALHGGSYDCHYFDADSNHTAAFASTAFGVPFVSIDRPGYGGTSRFTSTQGLNFPRETGRWVHQFILPALWTEFGVPNECNCVVLLCHSLGVMGGIIAAAMHGKDEEALYPLGGIIVSGLGDKQSAYKKAAPSISPNAGPDHILYDVKMKDNMMFPPGTLSPEIKNLSEHLNAVSPFAELESWPTVWLPTWRDDWACHVKAPVMFALVEDDCFFEATEKELETCASAFTTSARVDSSLIKGAPHCMELSYWSQGWYARCFGFAIECSTSFALYSR